MFVAIVTLIVLFPFAAFANTTSKPSSQPSTKKATKTTTKKKKMKSFSTKDLVSVLQLRNWWAQQKVMRELERRCSKELDLYKATGQKTKHLRQKLLLQLVIARCGGKPRFLLPFLEDWFDQPLPLILGVIREQGQSMLPEILASLKKTKNPRHFLQAISFFPSKSTLPVLLRFAASPKDKLRDIAFAGIKNFPANVQLDATKQLLSKSLSDSIRSDIYRFLSGQKSIGALKLMIASLKEKSASLRFYLKLSLRDLILEKTTLKKYPKSDKYDTWKVWLHWNLGTIKKTWKTGVVELKKISTWKKTVIVYRTIHPMFGFGKMPLVFYPASRKKAPTFATKRKMFFYPIPDKAFRKILRLMEKRGFFHWQKKSGFVRSITVSEGGKKRKVSVGSFRHFLFEEIESALLFWMIKKKDILMFHDFFNRLDEYDLQRDSGEIGSWSYFWKRKAKPVSWKVSKKKALNLTSAFLTIQEVFQRQPGRARIVELSAKGGMIHSFSLLYGTKYLLRRMNGAFLDSKRFLKVKFRGAGAIQLSYDKIEGVAFSIRPRLVSPVFKPRQQGDFAHLSQACFQNMSLLSLQYKKQEQHRFFLRAKVQGPKSILSLLSCLALRSKKGRLLLLRINHSGEKDRKKFPLILQAQWTATLLQKAPKKVPYFFSRKRTLSDTLFQPVYR